MGNANQFAGGSYLKPEDLTEPIATKINETFESVDFNGQPCLVLKLEHDDKKFQLNKTNVKTMIKLFGDDYEKWAGNEIGLNPGEYEFKDSEGDTSKGPTILVSAASDLPF